MGPWVPSILPFFFCTLAGKVIRKNKFESPLQKLGKKQLMMKKKKGKPLKQKAKKQHFKKKKKKDKRVSFFDASHASLPQIQRRTKLDLSPLLQP